MKAKYLGDSYDIVKRFFAESLQAIAPILAHTRFIPHQLRPDYTLITGISIWDGEPRSKPYAVLLDPDTGIPHPKAKNRGLRQTHAPLAEIQKILQHHNLLFIMCFDQSVKRQHKPSAEQQRNDKCRWLAKRAIHSFYYNSHAPFLFASGNREVLCKVRSTLNRLGLPAETPSTPPVIRLQTID